MKLKKVIITKGNGSKIKSGKMDSINLAKVIDFYTLYHSNCTFEVIDVN